MQLLDLTLPTAAENVALDEALLQQAEDAQEPCECLRIWEPTAPLVVIGRGSSLEREVYAERCAVDGVPILRRSSGGLSVVGAPGCLMYAVVLSYELDPLLRRIDAAHARVKETMVRALRRLAPDVDANGTCDLVRGGRKFSGNALRCRRTHLLYHGTLLYGMDLGLVTRYLKEPPRAPAYRGDRPHADFVAQLPASAEELRAALRDAWPCSGVLHDWPQEATAQLVRERYSDPEWTQRVK